MRAEVVSIGTELLMGQITDRNAAEIGRFCAEVGLDHYWRQTVGDNLDRIVEALCAALERSDIVFTIGGLGPTPDDLTREGIASASGRNLELDHEIEARLRRAFRERGQTFTENQAMQAMVPQGAITLANPNGTAPGLICPAEDKWLVALPGPPAEFVPMLQGPVREWISGRAGLRPVYSRIFRVAGIGEGALSEQIADLLEKMSPTLATYAKTGEVHLRGSVRADSAEEADSALDALERELRSRLGSLLYGTGDQTLAAVIGGDLKVADQTIASAESCTAGLLSALLTEPDGASEYFRCGYTTYAPTSKVDLLGVPIDLIQTVGTVSAEVAEAMAEGARDRSGADFAISITGVAGSEPLPEPPAPKPSGLVYIGFAGPAGTSSVELKFRGARSTIRERAAIAALTEFRRWRAREVSAR